MEDSNPLPDCREVFDIVDKDGSGYITRDQLAELCSSTAGNYSTSLLDSVMASLDADNDGQISFEKFKSGFESYRQADTSSNDVVCSTPLPMIQGEEIFESEPVLEDDGWAETAEKIDPQGLLKGTGVDAMWRQVSAQEPHLLDKFEKFLFEVVLQLDQSHQEKHTLQQRVRRMLESHNREVHEMDELLEKHLTLAEESKRSESARKTARLSTHYNSLLEEREAMIEQLAEKENALKKTLQDKTENERELTEERNYLLTANQHLRQRLSVSMEHLSTKDHQEQERHQEHEKHHEQLHLSDEQGEETAQSLNQRQQQLNLASVEDSEDHVKYYPPKKASFPTDQGWSSSPFGVSPPGLPTSPPREFKSPPRQTVGFPTSPPGLSSSPSRLPTSPPGLPTSPPRLPTSPPRLPTSPPGLPTSTSTDESRTLRREDHILSRDASITVSTWVPPSISDAARPTSTTALNRVFKVVFLGNSGVGKSSLIFRLCEGQFTTDSVATVGLDFYTKLLTIGDEQLVFQLWDTAGQERFHNALTPVYFRRADAFVVVYDVTDKKSFKSTKSWISIITAALRQHPPVLMIVGNKCDQSTKERQVSAEEGRALALEQQALFSEMSALSGDNVLQGHTTLGQLLLARENADLQAFKVHSLKLAGAPAKKCRC